MEKGFLTALVGDILAQVPPPCFFLFFLLPPSPSLLLFLPLLPPTPLPLPTPPYLCFCLQLLYLLRFLLLLLHIQNHGYHANTGVGRCLLVSPAHKLLWHPPIAYLVLTHEFSAVLSPMEMREREREREKGREGGRRGEREEGKGELLLSQWLQSPLH